MSISARITAFLVAQKIVPAEDSDIYEYGFELLLADLFNFSVILLIGGISGHLWPSVLYLLIFVGLRSVCGGYHAKTHLRCRISTIGVFVLFLVLFHIRPLADGGPLLLWGILSRRCLLSCLPLSRMRTSRCPKPCASATAGWRFFCILRLCAPRPCLDNLGGRKAS